MRRAVLLVLVAAAITAPPTADDTGRSGSRSSIPTSTYAAQASHGAVTTAADIRAATSYTRDVFPTGISRIKVIRYITPSGSPQLSAAQIDAVMAQVKGLYEKWSGGKWTFTHVVEEKAVPSFDCDGALGAFPSAPTGFDHVIEYGPADSATCKWSGLGTLGGSWIIIAQNTFTVGTVAHELGHNLGLQHASSVTCPTPRTIWTDCTISEYGDVAAVMGAGTYSLGALGTATSDWHDPAQIQVGVQGDVELAESPAAIVLPDPMGRGEYWIEYVRKATLSNLTADQVLVRYVSIDNVRNTRSLVLDRVAGPFMTGDGGFFVNDTFTDPSGAINVQVISLGATARLRISGGARATMPVWSTRLTGLDDNDAWLDIDFPTSQHHVQSLEITIWNTDGTITTKRLRPYVQSLDLGSPATVAAVRVLARELDGRGATNTFVLRNNPWVASPATAMAAKSGSITISLTNPSAYQRLKVTCGDLSPRVFDNPSAKIVISGTGKSNNCLAELQKISAEIVTATETVPLPIVKGSWTEVGADVVGDQGDYYTRLTVSRNCRKCTRATVIVERWTGSKWVRAKRITTQRSYWEWSTKTMAPQWRIKVNKTTYTPLTPSSP